MSKYREERRIFSDKVRNMCIKEGLYTRGTCEEYSHLLCVLCKDEEISMDAVETIAANILIHSAWEEKAAEYGVEYDELLRNVMSNLINECCYTFVIEE